MKKRSYVILAAGLLFCLLLLSVFIVLQIFTVRNVEVMKDFSMEDGKLLKQLGVQSNRYIWQYDIKKLENVLANQFFIDEYEVRKKYPDRMLFIIKIRKPVATISGKEGRLFYIDRRGIVFSRVKLPAGTEKQIPHLIVQGRQEKISKGTRLGGKYQTVVSLLYTLRKKEEVLYNSIAQVEIGVQKEGELQYVVDYKAINKRFYLKNQINVEIIKKGLCTALFLESAGSTVTSMFYSAIGVYY